MHSLGSEICMLSEAVSALPHPPVPSLLQNSVLVQMLAVSALHHHRPASFLLSASFLPLVFHNFIYTAPGSSCEAY
jgi:hypothetical protein